MRQPHVEYNAFRQFSCFFNVTTVLMGVLSKVDGKYRRKESLRWRRWWHNRITWHNSSNTELLCFTRDQSPLIAFWRSDCNGNACISSWMHLHATIVVLRVTCYRQSSISRYLISNNGNVLYSIGNYFRKYFSESTFYIKNKKYNERNLLLLWKELNSIIIF